MDNKPTQSHNVILAAQAVDLIGTMPNADWKAINAFIEKAEKELRIQPRPERTHSTRLQYIAKTALFRDATGF